MNERELQDLIGFSYVLGHPLSREEAKCYLEILSRNQRYFFYDDIEVCDQIDRNVFLNKLQALGLLIEYPAGSKCYVPSFPHEFLGEVFSSMSKLIQRISDNVQILKITTYRYKTQEDIDVIRKLTNNLINEKGSSRIYASVRRLSTIEPSEFVDILVKNDMGADILLTYPYKAKEPDEKGIQKAHEIMRFWKEKYPSDNKDRIRIRCAARGTRFRYMIIGDTVVFVRGKHPKHEAVVIQDHKFSEWFTQVFMESFDNAFPLPTKSIQSSSRTSSLGKFVAHKKFGQKSGGNDSGD